MTILRKVRSIISLDRKTAFLLLEAFVYLGWARLLIYRPFTKIAPYLGIQMQETSNSPNSTNQDILRNISHAIEVMSNHTFWESKCLVKAIACMKMLERRQIESTIYLGTAKSEVGELIAHAWLRSGSFFLTGAEVMSKYTIVGRFAKKITNI